MANYIKSDLDFILEQIKIAEAHTARIASGDDPRASLLDLIGGSPETAFGLRTVNGSLNNLVPGRENWGAADQPFPQVTDAHWVNEQDGDVMPLGPTSVTNTDYEALGSVADADPRIISNLLVDMTANNPAAVSAALNYHEIEGPEAAAIRAASNTLVAGKVTAHVLADAAALANAADDLVATADSAVADLLAALTALGDAAVTENETALVSPALTGLAAALAAAEGVVTALESNSGVDAALVTAAKAQVDALTAAQTSLEALTLNEGQVFDSVDSGHVTDANDATDGAAAAALTAAIQTASSAQVTTNETTLANLVADLSAAGAEFQGDSLVIPNVAPDEGLSAPFNSWMSLFGQFFDHGLDFVDKGGNGTIYMPLQPDDPLYDAGPDGIAGTVDDSRTNFMALTRATLDGANRTTPHVDQNQTYSSHPSMQVFLREWVLEDGVPVETGRLINGDGGGMANWGEIKAQARDVLGIELDDADALNAPQLATDLYGNAIRGANGFPQLVTDANGGMVEGSVTAPVDASVALRTDHAFLADIAHSAVPAGFVDHDRNPSTPDIEVLPDTDGVAGNLILPNQFGINETYDNELFDAHFVSGDGRVNENIGLTAVHHIFHSEHNRLLEYSKNEVIRPHIEDTTVDAADRLAFLNEWLRVDLAPGTDPASVDFDSLKWDGARLFQLAKFGTEMQYQHLVFEDFARKVQPQIDVFLAPVGYDVTIDPTILAEFAHVVYRFGHSMLNETVDRFDANFNTIGEGWVQGADEQIGLIEAFLNPLEFDAGGVIDADVAAGAVIRGMTRQTGNEIDEFVTDALRSNLLGLPLDLAAINIARGRDTGMPTLQGAREDFFNMTGDSQLRPYDSWVDFMLNLKNQSSIVNFIAAYGTHELLNDAETLAEKREAAMKLVFGDADLSEDDADAFNTDRLAFLNATGSYSAETSGLNDVDFWIGGLAEAIAPFGGMLGSTFNFIFETQLEALQDGDRFYYLARTASMNFLAELENNSFSSMMIENTDVRHIHDDAFARADWILEVDPELQFTGLGADGRDDPFEPSFFNPSQNALVIRDAPNSLEYTGGEHVVLGGTEGNDILIGGIGDDALWGDGGDDTIEGGHGVDNIDGGAGDDIITDIGGDDVIKGNDGNDVIHGGPGLNLIISGRGHDFVVTGEDSSATFAGPGNDFVLGSTTNEAPVGGEGDDWIEGGAQDGAAGDNSDAFGNDLIAGHDVFVGRDGFNEFVAEGGDDIMISTGGLTRNEGMSGFDWVTYKERALVYGDLLLPAFDETPQQPGDAALDRYAQVEGLSGSHGHDTLLGGDEVDLTNLPDAAEPGAPAENGAAGSELSVAGMARIAGLAELVGSNVVNDPNSEFNGAFVSGNIILGGDGDDVITGRGGNDIIDGDKWLNVRIEWNEINPETQEFWTWDFLGTEDGNTNDLSNRMLAGEIEPEDLRIVREILTVDAADDIDTAVFSGLLADYDVQIFGGGAAIVTDLNVDDGDDGQDTLYGIERLQFADVSIINGLEPIGAPDIVERINPDPDFLSPTEGQELFTTLGNLEDADGLPDFPAGFTFQWQWSGNTTVWRDIDGATGETFTPTQDEVNRFLRVQVTYTDGIGSTHTVTSALTARVGDDIQGTGANEDLRGTNGADIVAAGAGADLIRGFDGDDDLAGQAGNDTFIGGAGNDTMRGGNGDDRFNAVEAGDVVFGGGGIDTIVTAENIYVLHDSVEELIFNGLGDFTGTGNASANFIRGGDGNDVIDGLAGADRMVGLDGDDTYFVDDSGDVVAEGVDMGFDTVFATASFNISNNVEVLDLIGDADIDGIGSAADNMINGNGGANTLRGLAGDDELFGRGGNDRILGDDGNDRILGGNGDDLLRGGAGEDILIGNAGDDTFFGDGGADRFRFNRDEGFGIDRIRDFEDGVDIIDLRGLGLTSAALTVDNVIDIRSIGAGGVHTRIDIADNDGGSMGSIILTGFDAGNIDVDDFLFA